MAARARNVSYAYRRTVEFLSSGKIYLKRNVMAIHIKYTTHTDTSAGTRYEVICACSTSWFVITSLRWFAAEEVPKLQYKNPRVQILISKNESPSPSIDIYHSELVSNFTQLVQLMCIGRGDIVHIDTDNKSSDDILGRLAAIAAKDE